MSGKREQPPKIWVYWSKREKDFMVNWDDGCTIPSARYVVSHFTKEFIEELQSRGYDTTTLRFSIKKKPVTEGAKQ